MGGKTGSSRSEAVAFGQRAAAGGALTTRQRVVGLGFVAACLAVIAALAVISAPSSASRPTLFGGSLVLANQRGEPVVIDLTSGALTTRFSRLVEYVDREDRTVRVTTLANGTLLVSSRGSINFLGLDNYLARADGLRLGDDLTDARAVGAGKEAFVVANDGDDTYVAFVDRATVESGKTKATKTISGGRGAQAHALTTTGNRLWMIRADGRLLELAHVKPDDAQLTVTTHERLDATAALAAGGAGGMRLVAATGDSLRVFGTSTNGLAAVVPSGVEGVTRIVPSVGSGRVVWFLYENADGWWTVGADTERGTRVGPERVEGTAFTAEPIEPAYSRGHLYTLDGRATGGGDTPVLVAIDPASGRARSIEDAGGEPLHYTRRAESEQPDFGGAHVIPSGARIVFNNPDASFAHVVFIDDSRTPVLVDKTDDRNQFDPTQSPSELVTPPPPDDTAPTTAPADGDQAPAPVAAPAPAPQEVDTQLDCVTAKQKPHAPLILGATSLPRAVTVGWSYEAVDTRDCVPSSFTVTVRPLGGARGVERAQRQVDGQQQITFDGLRPNSTYEFVVTAHIGDEATASRPVQATTLTAGPEQPTSVTAVADPTKGVWRVSWTACGANCDVPVAAWVVQGVELCSAGNTAALPIVDAPGGATSIDVPYPDALVGRSVRFQVYGRAEDGTNGDARQSDRCTEGWRPPALEKLSFSATPTGANPDGKINATLALTVSGNPVVTFGSTDVQLVYAVDGAIVATRGLPGGDRDEVTTTVTPAVAHTATLTVTSHGKSWVLTAKNFQQNIPWSTLKLDASPVLGANPNVGAVQATVNGVYVNAPGTTVVASGTLVCGNKAPPPFADRPVNATGGFTVENVDLIALGGQCEINVTFREPGPARVHEGVSPSVKATVNFGRPGNQTPVGTFNAILVDPEAPVLISGTPSPFGGDLTITVRTKRHDFSCGAPVSVARAPAISINVDIASCVEAAKAEVKKGKFQFALTITVIRQYLGSETRTEFDSPEIQLQAGPDETTTTDPPTTTTPPTTTMNPSNEGTP